MEGKFGARCTGSSTAATSATATVTARELQFVNRWPGCAAALQHGSAV